MPKVTSHSVPRKIENLLGTWDTSSSILACDCCHIRPGVMFQAVPRQLGSLPRQMVCAGRGSPSRFYGLRAPRRPHCPTGGPLNVRPGRFGRVHFSPLNHVFSSFFIEQVELFWTFVFSFLEVPKDDATWWVSSVFRLQLHLCFLGNLTCLWLVCSQARESFVITTGTSKPGSSPTKSKVCWVTNDDQWWLQQTLLLIAASIATDSEHSEPRIWWFWWLEVVVISRVHPSRIFLHQQTHGHSQ